MPRVQFTIRDEERDRFVRQARLEGLTLSAWLRAAARARLELREGAARFESPEELAAFFRECDALPGPDREPDWEDHLRVIEESRRRGAIGS